MNVPKDGHILKVQSRTFDAILPGALFEWHQNEMKLYVIKPLEPARALRDGVLIAELIRTPMEAKQAVAAYVQGFVHGKQEAERESASKR